MWATHNSKTISARGFARSPAVVLLVELCLRMPCRCLCRPLSYQCNVTTDLCRGGRGCRNEKKKLGVSNTPYHGGRWITDGGRWITDGGWWITDGGWCVTDGGWWVTDGGWWVTDGGWWVTDGGWWVATKHQRVDAIVKKKRVSVLMAPPEGGSQKFVYQKWPDQILPIVNFVLSPDGPFGLAVGGGGGTVAKKTSLARACAHAGPPGWPYGKCRTSNRPRPPRWGPGACCAGTRGCPRCIRTTSTWRPGRTLGRTGRSL